MAHDFGRELRRLLHEAGCRRERQAKGSHEWWYSPISRRSFPVPYKVRSRHTANEALKQAGLPKQF
jgi:hypothetical protein